MTGHTPWTLYSEARPDEPGTYEWRMPHKWLDGLIVRLAAQFRQRGAGYATVLSPAFDYWDGYKVIVPTAVEWRPTDFDLGRRGTQLLFPEGVENVPCLYCEQMPQWKGVRRGAGSSGVVITADPHEYDDWWLECCAWGRTPSFSDPRDLTARRNAALAKAQGER